MTPTAAVRQERVFDAVLEREVAWGRLAASTATAAALLGLLLAALVSGARHAVREQRPHYDPIVTFLDLPQPAAPEAPAPRTVAGGGASGQLVAELSNGSTTTKAHIAPTSKAERVAALTDRAKATVADEAPREAVATPAPTAQGAGRANEGPVAAPSSTPETAGSPQALGNGAGGGGGSGNGAGGGAGAGNGPGTQAGANEGRYGVLPFGDGMTRPSLVNKVDPTYTHEAMDGRVSGVALVKCVLGTDGAVRSCRIVKGLPFMNDAILSAVSRWRYSPVVYQGHPVAVEYLITLHLSPP